MTEIRNLRQLSLFPTLADDNNSLSRFSFSHEDVCAQDERIALEERYAEFLEETSKFNRKLVSYQGNKGAIIHGWIKYREGFSAQLVEDLIREFRIEPGGKVLDPFSGSSTTLLVAKSMGIDAVGIEIMSVCHLAWEAKSIFYEYDLGELKQIRAWLVDSQTEKAEARFPHITITESAFPPEAEHAIMFYTHWVENLDVSKAAKTLLRLILTSILEEVSYTRKDGQYLRWDYRSEKVRERNRIRQSQGKKPIKKVDLGSLPSVKEALVSAFDIVIADIRKLQELPFRQSHQELIKGNSMYVLPTLEPNQFDAVITSPPYCNRYDYTRTYALELAYLGEGDGIFDLRQNLLSCTVENRSKLNLLQEHYKAFGRGDRFDEILQTVWKNAAFQEINRALQNRWERGDMNNRGVLRMVEQYFTELTFIFAELLRICKPGARVAFVNDNVRYGGEVIPVDLLTTDLAVNLGFEPVKIYVLPQRKGNSSQQMSRFGREALRKSITVWRKPNGKRVNSCPESDIRIFSRAQESERGM
ncbi:MAG: site-specific DNA-methyltransferase [Chloroflexi bacterium]|nr:site-specific DNA-methyltransferase [Chloroflexota bacterium]